MAPKSVLRLSVWALGLACSITCEPFPAFAEELEPGTSRVFLELEVLSTSEACTSKSELEQAVQIQLGRTVFAAAPTSGAATVHVRIEEVAAPRRFRARVSLREATSPASPAGATSAAAQPSLEERELESKSCRDLDQELALVIALLVDSPPAQAIVDEPSRLPPPPPEPPPAPPDDVPVSSAPTWDAQQRKPWQLELDAAAIVSFGTLPSVGAGAEVGAQLSAPVFFAVRWRLASFVPSAADAGPNAEVALFRAETGLALCPVLVDGRRFILRSCVGADATLLRATPNGLSKDETVTRIDFRPGVSLRAGVRLGSRWLSVLSASAGIPSRVYRFTYEQAGGLDTAFEEAVIPVWVTLGLSYETLP